MVKNELEFDSGNHHKPRNLDKNKRRKAGFTEDKAANRQARIGFKNYLRELAEDELDEELDNELDGDLL